ncbi:hypothetical protein [Streptomyces californicus]|uniref:hypothetical protein n=1 Tax=Streptomyces californicus TaxID=67351 RepID=UPI0037BBA1A6
MDGSRGAALRRARSAALIGLTVAFSSGCSGGGDGGRGGDHADRAARPPGAHSWTGRPCALLRGASPADGFVLGSATDSASPGAREDIGEDGARARYRRADCLAELTGPDGASWKLTTTASVYEGAGAARQAYRAREDLDRAHGRGPEKVREAAYAIPADDRGRPGRTLLLRNGDLVLTVSAYAPFGSRAGDVREGLDRIVAGAAHRTERGLRASGSPAP